MAHTQLYFSHYLPRYFGIRLPIMTAAPKTDMDVIYLSPAISRQNIEIIDLFINEHPYWFLEQSKKLSSTLQGKGKPYVVTDAGAGSAQFDDYVWYLYKEKRGILD
jgi:hypothetical protein